MRLLRFLGNWLLIITMPIWAGFMVWVFILKEREFDILLGRRWLFSRPKQVDPYDSAERRRRGARQRRQQ